MPLVLLPISHVAEHSMAMPAIRRRWTAADVRALQERAWPRYELIDGELLVTPSPRTAHQLVVLEFAVALHQYCGRNPVGVALTSPADLGLKPDSVTQPDVFVVPADTDIAGEQVEWPDVNSLLLAVEVLSPSSIRTDRVTKRDFYLSAGVAEYWVVDIDARFVEVWMPAQETPRVVHERLTWAPDGAEPLEIDLPALFDRVARKFGKRL
jgi:Uma2 family endonuclease